jgi:cellulose synthase/poly-beta-1,6-N-acetylglucosamine synthase-like glycosyltransferase
MTLALEWIFWIAVVGIAYVYFGYPLLVYVGSRLFNRPVRKVDHQPTVSIVIAAYNEVAHIGETLENKLALDYPVASLQIIVVSDGSSDGTDDVARRFESRGVRVLRQEPRNGKTGALNLALRHATGDVVVFADANSLYAKDALRHLVSNFADPTVGYVTGKLAYLNSDGSMTGDGCSMYMKYENFIRTCESAIGSLVGVNGGIDAVRRSLYSPMDPDDLPDLVLPLRVVARGYRVVYEPAAVLSEPANANASDEYRMRVRVALRALWTLADMPSLMSIRQYGFYAWQLLSHKALRYLGFLFMAVMFVATILLWPVGAFYKVVLVGELAFIGSALLGFAAERSGQPNRLLSVPYYFVLVNAAASQAFVKFLRGERHRMWKPRLG